jgi:hypothetical protein
MTAIAAAARRAETWNRLGAQARQSGAKRIAQTPPNTYSGHDLR